MSRQPLISVIMPCYNAAAYLREAVDSVLTQTYTQVELIVIDDGSTDDSRRILQEYGDRIRVLDQANRGPYPARNMGLAHAGGELVAFLDADDWWRPDCLELLEGALQTHPDAALAYCGWQNVQATDRNTDPHVPPDYGGKDKLARLLSGGSPWPIHAALTRKSVIDARGGFRTDLPTSMDFDLWLAIAARYEVVLVPEILAFYRFSVAGQISSRPWRQAVNGWKLKMDFLRSNADLLVGQDVPALRQAINRALLQRGYAMYWRGDLTSAHKVFRQALRVGAWDRKDLKYLLPALLPEPAYRGLIGRLRGAGG